MQENEVNTIQTGYDSLTHLHKCSYSLFILFISLLYSANTHRHTDCIHCCYLILTHKRKYTQLCVVVLS